MMMCENPDCSPALSLAFVPSRRHLLQIISINGSRREKGNTLTLLTNFAADIGLDVISSVKALNCFEAGGIAKARVALSQAESAGKAFLRQTRSSP